MNMKQSLKLRALVIIAVVGCWVASIFPYKDQPFKEVLIERQIANDPKLDQAIIDAEKKVEESQAKAKANDEARERGENVPHLHVISFEKAFLDVSNEIVEDGGIRRRKLNLRDYYKVYGKSTPSNEEVINYLKLATKGKIALGLDLRGGTEFIVAFNPDDIPANTSEIQIRDDIRAVLQKRIDPEGVKEIEIRANGDNALSLRTPSVDPAEVDSIRKMLTQSAKLTFHLVHPENDSLVRSNERIVPGYKLAQEQNADELGNVVYSPIWIKRETEKVNGEHIKTVNAAQGQFGNWLISWQFDDEGGSYMLETTTYAANHKPNKLRLAIALDGIVISAPSVEGPFGTSGQITGNFTQDSAVELATLLRSGSLPVPIKIEGEMATQPTLGADLVKGGVYACAIGATLVLMLVLIYYRVAGIVTAIALTVNIVLIIGSLTLVGAALTLPGIAGIVLTIGMAVDANVLIFERIREEMNNGKSIETAVRNGFQASFFTIVDANLTTLFTAFFLYLFGSGAIRGFAVTLTFGILGTLFTALFLSRWLFDLFMALNIIKSDNPKLLHIRVDENGKTKTFDDINFNKYRGMATTLSAILIVGSFIVFAVRNRSALSIDFNGGTLITMSYDGAKDVSTKNVVEALDQAIITRTSFDFDGTNVKDADLLAGLKVKGLDASYLRWHDQKQNVEVFFPGTLDAKYTPESIAQSISEILKGATIENPSIFYLKGFKNPKAIKKDSAVSESTTLELILQEKLPEDMDASQFVTDYLNSVIKDADFEAGSTSIVGSLVGEQFKEQALYAIFFALIGIIGYISFRFEFSYALGAVAALTHDVIIGTGIFLVWGFGFDREISLTAIAAILTIIGYSLNDTIVIFDRIRENVSLFRRESLPSLINKSINQTLGRTVLTSITTLLVVVVLYFVGGGPINDFAAIMIIGIGVGTYSSIFVAVPVMLWAYAKFHKEEDVTVVSATVETGK
ncbi:MAG: protein translocase subunit SecD [Lentisphaeria bacterium]|nr:protein translocase subunit SecD [Lentisphaeria bacterium]